MAVDMKLWIYFNVSSCEMLHFVTSYTSQSKTKNKKNVNKLSRVRSTDWKSSLSKPIHPRTQRLCSPWPAVGKRETLERSDLKSDNIGLPVELRMLSWQTRGSFETLVFYFRSFPLFLKPIKIEPVTELSRVARLVKSACAVRNEDSRYEIGRRPAHKFAAVSTCTTWSRASRKFKSLFPLVWPMTRDTFSSNRKTCLNWDREEDREVQQQQQQQQQPLFHLEFKVAKSLISSRKWINE